MCVRAPIQRVYFFELGIYSFEPRRLVVVIGGNVFAQSEQRVRACDALSYADLEILLFAFVYDDDGGCDNINSSAVPVYMNEFEAEVAKSAVSHTLVLIAVEGVIYYKQGKRRRRRRCVWQCM